MSPDVDKFTGSAVRKLKSDIGAKLEENFQQAAAEHDYQKTFDLANFLGSERFGEFKNDMERAAMVADDAVNAVLAKYGLSSLDIEFPFPASEPCLQETSDTSEVVQKSPTPVGPTIERAETRFSSWGDFFGNRETARDLALVQNYRVAINKVVTSVGEIFGDFVDPDNEYRKVDYFQIIDNLHILTVGDFNKVFPRSSFSAQCLLSMLHRSKSFGFEHADKFEELVGRIKSGEFDDNLQLEDVIAQSIRAEAQPQDEGTSDLKPDEDEQGEKPDGENERDRFPTEDTEIHSSIVGTLKRIHLSAEIKGIKLRWPMSTHQMNFIEERLKTRFVDDVYESGLVRPHDNPKDGRGNILYNEVDMVKLLVLYVYENDPGVKGRELRKALDRFNDIFPAAKAEFDQLDRS